MQTQTGCLPDYEIENLYFFEIFSCVELLYFFKELKFQQRNHIFRMHENE